MEIEDILDDAKAEMKRADHLMFVSLKYSRTVDVIKNVISRLINAFDYGIQALLENALKKNEIVEVPIAHNLRCKKLLKIYTDEKTKSNINLYHILRKIIKSKFVRKKEYRRDVAMIVLFGGNKLLEVNMDSLKEYYFRVKKFVEFVEEEISEKSQND